MPAPEDEAHILFAGLPETGKTTYLALLYTAISGGYISSLRLGAYTDDREYVNEIAKPLLACEKAKHTKAEDQVEVALSLSVGQEHRSLQLGVPDLSGEIWEHAIYQREWSRRL